jgi:hypothetical protein
MPLKEQEIRQKRIKKIAKKIIVVFFLWSISQTILASPPFITDDPQPTDYQHLEVYLFSSTSDIIGATTAQFPAVEFDWGAIPNVQLHLLAPFTTYLIQNTPSTAGLGDTEVGFTYRFIEETTNRPEVGLVPVVELPTGNPRRNLGNGKIWVKLPLWLQKSWGSWTTYGGGGYVFNSAVDMRNYPYGGWVLQHELNEKITLGGEIFAQGTSAVGGDTTSRGFALLNLGGSYNFTKNFSLLFSAGHSVYGQSNLVTYLGLYWLL